MTITAEQLRAARALLKLEQRMLSERSGVNVQTLKRYEGGSGPLSGNYQNISALIAVLQADGVVFLSDGEVSVGPGVALRLGIPVSTGITREVQVGDPLASAPGIKGAGRE